MFENRADKALFLIQEGYTAQEIVKLCDYANISCVFNLAKSHGLKVKKAHADLHIAMREYKAQGHTMREVAEKFGVCKGTAQQICKGINPQQNEPPKARVEPHPCYVCGKITDKPKYCSTLCARRANYTRQNTRRRAKIQNALVDGDITLYKLFNRDNGRCHICGGECDWNDYRHINNRFVCGNNYPTIDHVIPLAKGGMHSWDNVRLAHHSCNSAKGDRVYG